MSHKMPFSEYDLARASAVWCNPECDDAVELAHYERIVDIVDNSELWNEDKLDILAEWVKKYPFGY